jgi:hypothetical protein
MNRKTPLGALNDPIAYQYGEGANDEMNRSSRRMKRPGGLPARIDLYRMTGR